MLEGTRRNVRVLSGLCHWETGWIINGLLSKDLPESGAILLIEWVLLGLWHWETNSVIRTDY